MQRCCCATTSAAATKKLPRLTFGGVATAAEGRRGVAEVAVEGLGQALQRGGGAWQWMCCNSGLPRLSSSSDGGEFILRVNQLLLYELMFGIVSLIAIK